LLNQLIVFQLNSVETFTATIYCGFKEGYDGEEYAYSIGERVCQEYCDVFGMGLTIEPTTFIYKNGKEHGMRVGLINYPRFPKKPIEIKNIAIEIAHKLKEAYGQLRVSIVCSDDTYMIGDM